MLIIQDIIDFETIEELGNSMSKYSYENYINDVNSNADYKYTDWRVPTKEELLSISLKDNLYTKMFYYDKNQICIDTKIFYDYIDGDYYASTKVNDKVYRMYFDCLRFKVASIGNSVPCSGVQISEGNQRGRLRLVRDI